VISVGTILHDTYRIEEELGRGGMGRVFAASHTRLPRRFAVKVLMGATDEQALRRFKREAEICSAIGHQHIVEVFDFNEVEGQPYIVMELLHGDSLRKAFEGQPTPARTFTIQLVQEVGKALAAAHAAGVVHRDLKPENIFLCREDGAQKFKVLDFGISKIIGARSLATREDMLLGTPGYMSPEQARGDVQLVSEKADQFALATIIYEALSGQAAFVAPEDTPYTVLYKIVHREPVPLFGQSSEVQRVLAKAMAKHPDERYGDVGEFAEAMVAALLRVPETVATARPARAGKPARWALALATVGVVAAGGATALLVQRVQAQRAAAAQVAADKAAADKAAADKGAADKARLEKQHAEELQRQADERLRLEREQKAQAQATPTASAPPKPAALAKPAKSGPKPTKNVALPRPPQPQPQPQSKPAGKADDDELSNPYAPEK
jgi:predicted Ser/Thr protein kinase